MNTRRTTTPKSVQASRLNRRDFLIRGGLMGAGALSLPALLAACGSDSGSTADTVGGGGDSSLFFENWPGYMDEETIGLFQAASGVSLKYTTSMAYFTGISNPNTSCLSTPPFLKSGL
jgi:hypothetical protein